MKNSAKWELRVGLLLGLAFIIAFGMILSELRDPVTQPSTEDESVVDTSYYQSTQPSLERETSVENIDPVPVDLSRETHTASRDVRVDMGHMQSAVISRQEVRAPAQERPPLQQLTAPQPQRTTRTYRVVDGDTLYQIAQKEYGNGNGPKWRKIYEANRDKLSKPSAIKAGQTLVIPSLGQSAPAAVEASPQEALDHIRSYVSGSSATPSAPARSRSTSRAKVHVVKSGDNLTKIARRYLGDSSSASIDKIFEANRDQLNDPNDIVLGMKLRIPAN